MIKIDNNIKLKMHIFYIKILITLTLQISLCLNLQISLSISNNNPHNLTLIKPLESKGKSNKGTKIEKEDLNFICKNLKDAVILNKNLIEKVQKLEKIMEHHSNKIIIKQNNTEDFNSINNNNLPEKTDTSSEKFLKDLSNSYRDLILFNF